MRVTSKDVDGRRREGPSRAPNPLRRQLRVSNPGPMPRDLIAPTIGRVS